MGSQAPTVLPFQGGRKAAFSLEFDDSMDSQVKNALPVLTQHRVQATFYINPGRNNYRAETWEKAILALGHELGNHTMHHGDTVGAEQASREIGDAAKVIEKAVGRPVLTPFATPGGVRWDVPGEDFHRILGENRLFFPRRKDFYQDGQGDILRFPKAALEKEAWGQLGFHGIGGEWLSTSVENFASLIRYLDQHRRDFWIAPTGTVWKYRREREAVTGIDLTPDEKGGFSLVTRFDRKALEPFELYGVPLTYRIPVPSKWKAAWAYVDGQKRGELVEKGAVTLDLLPSVRTVRLERATHPPYSN